MGRSSDSSSARSSRSGCRFRERGLQKPVWDCPSDDQRQVGLSERGRALHDSLPEPVREVRLLLQLRPTRQEKRDNSAGKLADVSAGNLVDDNHDEPGWPLRRHVVCDRPDRRELGTGHVWNRWFDDVPRLLGDHTRWRLGVCNGNRCRERECLDCRQTDDPLVPGQRRVGRQPPLPIHAERKWNADRNRHAGRLDARIPALTGCSECRAKGQQRGLRQCSGVNLL